MPPAAAVSVPPQVVDAFGVGETTRFAGSESLIVTPLSATVALLVSALGTTVPPHELVSDRLWATLLGAAIAVVVARVAPKGAWLDRVENALARVRDLSTAPRVDAPRLRAALVELHEAYDVAAGEVRSERLPTEQLLAVSHRAYEVLDGRSPVEAR